MNHPIQCNDTHLSQRVIILLILLITLPGILYAVEEVTLQKIKAGVFISPPFVMAGEHGEYEGMAIDLWKMVANPLNLVTEYTEYPSLDLLIKALQTGETEIALTNLTVTYERAQFMKFSFPWYDGGLRILVKSDRKGTLWKEMKQNGQFHAYCCIILNDYPHNVLL
ncbi:MAG: transporter substrate-binding domain-containing protein [Tannerellaceae bacterium]|nr:transporter substrate-binding domain-containing protein [Tannerellaceae bacterium]